MPTEILPDRFKTQFIFIIVDRLRQVLDRKNVSRLDDLHTAHFNISLSWLTSNFPLYKISVNVVSLNSFSFATAASTPSRSATSFLTSLLAEWAARSRS